MWRPCERPCERSLATHPSQARTGASLCPPRYARYEAKKSGLVQVAQDDELRHLRSEVSSMSRDLAEKEAKLAEVAYLPAELERLRKQLQRAEEEAKDAVAKRDEAEADVLRQLDSSKELLEKLLTEQRAQSAGEGTKLKARLAKEAEARRAAEAELAALRDAADSVKRDHDAEVRA